MYVVFTEGIIFAAHSRYRHILTQPTLCSSIADLSSIKGGVESEAAKKYGYPMNTWDVRAITDFHQLFRDRVAFNEDISDWDTSRVTLMHEMFDGCVQFNQPIGKWNVSQVWTMSDMFNGARSFNQPLDQWDFQFVGAKRILDRMFLGASSFNQNLCSWGSYILKMESFERTFAGTACPNQRDPEWLWKADTFDPEPAGPFCHVCVN